MKSKMNTYLWGVLIASTLLAAAACSGGSSDESSSSGSSTTSSDISTLGDLPKATAPVEESSSSSESAKALTVKPSALATTGMSLGTSPSFDSNSSLAACEMYNQTRQAVSEAAQGDLILCYIQQIFTAAESGDHVIVDSNGDSLTVDVYDGQPHIFGLELGSGDEGDNTDDNTPDHIKFQVVKDGDTISAFTMYACREGVQMMYLNQTIGSDGTFEMADTGTFTSTGNSGSYRTDVTGTIDGTHFVGEKPIHMQFSDTWDAGSEGGGSNWGDITFTQGSDAASVSGYMHGNNTSNDGTFTWTNTIAGDMQLLDGNSDSGTYNLSLLALGEGAVLGQATGGSTTDSSMTWDEQYTEAWDGDTGEAIDSSTFLDELDGTSLPTATEPSIAFGSGEAYDCSGTEEGTVLFANSTTNVEEACSNLELDGTWIDCWNTIGL